MHLSSLDVKDSPVQSDPDVVSSRLLIQRRAVASDLPRMWEVRTAAVRLTCATHYSADIIATMLASPPPSSMSSLIEAGGAFVEEDGGSIVGYAILDIEAGEVEALFVDPTWQGRGIARRLFARAETIALTNGLGRLFLSSSLNAVKFYESVGFKTVRTTIYQHRSGIGIPAVLMEKPLAGDISPI